jgi:hypothetical protein
MFKTPYGTVKGLQEAVKGLQEAVKGLQGAVKGLEPAVKRPLRGPYNPPPPGSFVSLFASRTKYRNSPQEPVEVRAGGRVLHEPRKVI